MTTAYIIIALAWLFVLATFHAYHHWQAARQLDRRNVKLMAVVHEQRRRLMLRDAQLADARSISHAQDERIGELGLEVGQRDVIIADQIQAMRLIRQRMTRWSIISTDYHYTDAWRN